MVDNLNPTNQFHPYQPVKDTPNADKVQGGLASVNWKDSISMARDFAKAKPGMALGALAALAIGLGMLRRRR